MNVRELEKQERKYALDIIWSVFCSLRAMGAL